MEITLKLKWDAFKKGIPCDVSCRNEAYLIYLIYLKPIYASSYVQTNLQKTTSPTN
jgi:hypothetical protein